MKNLRHNVGLQETYYGGLIVYVADLSMMEVNAPHQRERQSYHQNDPDDGPDSSRHGSSASN